MYNSDLPNRAELPSSAQLIRSTVIAAVTAMVLLVTVVLPAEFAVDPTGIGKILGLTQVGQTKATLAKEAATDAAASHSAATPPALANVTGPVGSPPGQPRADEVKVTLKPGEAAEIKLDMRTGDKVTYEWSAEGPVNYDTHADSPTVEYHGYSMGEGEKSDSGELVAAFDGRHGWYWRNRGPVTVTVTLKTTGAYTDIKRVM